jgi:hypothetical protein
MKFSSLKMPQWWQRMWNKRYPGMNIYVATDAGMYRAQPMKCGCGYKVFAPGGERVGPHCPTVRGAMRRIRKDCK